MSSTGPDEKHVGDETLQRIDDLAGGWTLPKRLERESPVGSSSASSKGLTSGKVGGPVPLERNGAAAEVGASKKKKVPREKTRAKGKERGKTASVGRRPLAEPSIPPWPRAPRGTEQPPGGWPGDDARAATDERVPTEVSDRAITRAMSERVATEEFDRAPTRLLPEDPHGTDELDHSATLVFGDRAALEIDRAARVARAASDDGDEADEAPRTTVDVEPKAPVREALSETAGETEAGIGQAKPIVDHDETVLQMPGSGVYSAAAIDAERKAGNITAILRLPPTLPRRPGVLGDMLYVPSAFFGVFRAYRELARVDRKLEAEKQSRSRRLADVARLALADGELDSETVTRGREEIIELEDQRSRQAGAAAGADAEIAALEREREDDKKRHTQELDALRRSSKEMEEKLEPLQRRLRAARRRAIKLHEGIKALDSRVARQVASMAELGQEQVAGAEAHIASLRAERRGLALEEPILAGEIDDLEPAIASLVASLAEARARAARIEKEERIGILRTAEKVTAVKTRRVVDERAEAELAQAQEEALAALGDRLSVERPPELAFSLRGIEEHEVAIGTLDRSHLELTELVRGVDRWALVRGVFWLFLLAVAIAAALVWSFALPTP